VAAEGQKEVARSKAPPDMPGLNCATSSRERPGDNGIMCAIVPERGFVVTAQCPQGAGAMIFAAADELTNFLALPRYT